MHYIRGIEDYAGNGPTAVTMGKFDGLHIGHQKLIEQIRGYADGQNVKSIVFAFDMIPFERALGQLKKKIMTNRERRCLLADRVDYLIECPFTKEIHDMKAAEFVEKVLIERLQARYVVIGADFHFGYQRQGDAELLKHYEQKGAFKVDVLPKECYQGREISSSYVKEVLPEGDIGLVNRLLGYPYTIVGDVVHGNRIGRTLGMPTMNLQAEENKLLPPFGVYVCQIKVEEKWYDGICNIGVKPTVGDDNKISIESHLFDYREEAYGKEIAVRLYRRERGEMKFDGIADLKEQMQKDIAKGKVFFRGENK